MPRYSQFIKFPDGGTAIICGYRTYKACSVCHKPRSSEKLCDGDLGGGKTCDKPLCTGCAKHVAPNKDYCPSHAP